MSDDCDRFEIHDALKIAKDNVRKHFAVVGILERWQETLQLLEHYVPAYFKNARQIYNGAFKMDKSKMNKNNFKYRTPDYIKKIVSANFTLELDFYEFCKQRFQQQLLTIKYF